jgi:general secretion pathway protein B
MSFILDALKKSESDRQRQNGPAFFEVKVAPPRTRLPAWAIAIAALLVVNLGIVMWLLMRHPAGPNAEGATATAGGAAGNGAVTPAATVQTPPPSTVLARAAAGTPPLSAPPPPASAENPPVATPAPGAPAPAAAPTTAATTATTGAAGGGAASPPADGANPEDYAPAQDEAPAPSGQFNGRVRRGTDAGVPLYQDAAATPGTQIPQLRLDLHVFALRPQDRFVMINMHKLHEGDTTPEGVRVESITTEGAVLTFNGSRFLLPRE